MFENLTRNELCNTSFDDYKGKAKYIVTYYFPTDENGGVGRQWVYIATDDIYKAKTIYLASVNHKDPKDDTKIKMQFLIYELNGDKYEPFTI